MPLSKQDNSSLSLSAKVKLTVRIFMSMLDIFIIVVATASAIIFKVSLYKRIQRWMDQDLIKGLANGDNEKHSYLSREHQRLISEKTPRKLLHQLLTEHAKHYSSE